MTTANEATKIQYLKGVGPKMAEKLRRLGIETAEDLIFHWPRRYEDYTKISKIADILNGQRTERTTDSAHFEEGDDRANTIRARIVGVANKLTSRQRMKITEAIVEDGTGTIKLVWFNQPFLKQMLRVGSEWIFHGKVTYDSFNHVYVMESPNRVKFPCVIPVYPTTAGLTNNYIAKLISYIINPVSRIKEFLPQDVITKYELLSLADTVLKIHTPVDLKETREAQRRIAFDEILLLALRSRLIKHENKACRAPVMHISDDELKGFVNNLPFELTDDQKKVAWKVVSELQREEAMNRLINGDVGSGKTVVAAIAAYVAIRSGARVLLMVPTEVLASQHFSTFCSIFSGQSISVGLMTSSMKKTSQVSKSPKGTPCRGECQISNRNTKPEGADIVIGTQALIQKGVSLDNVGLVIVDEQHRFGVGQRAALRQMNKVAPQRGPFGGASQQVSKSANEYSSTPQLAEGGEVLHSISSRQSSNSNNADSLTRLPAYMLEMQPHFLSMTATPIPRTLYLALFDDLSVSVIRQKPKNRREIKTRFVEPHNRAKAYEFITRQIEAGRQVFVVCPLIDDQEGQSSSLFDEDKKSVVKEYEKLSKQIFPDYRVVMLHGKMKPKEKDSILSDFASKKFDILVSTSVIEVGIDVPNATVMIIEDAERFGLAQIHQFRGRVGRGDQQSFCFLFSSSRSPKAIERLHSLENISDGFKLAEIDLQTRGPGDILGTLQSGQVELKMASFCDKMLIEQASEAASFIFKEDPELSRYPALKERLLKLESNKHME